MRQKVKRGGGTEQRGKDEKVGRKRDKMNPFNSGEGIPSTEC